ncbi:hypothetical protein KIPB_006893, partial [Kipferlia bialata]|eukprot:g6893.t1
MQCYVLDYDAEEGCYLIQWAPETLFGSTRGVPASVIAKRIVQKWVKRHNLVFDAENEQVWRKRVEGAKRLRADSEATIRRGLYLQEQVRMGETLREYRALLSHGEVPSCAPPESSAFVEIVADASRLTPAVLEPTLLRVALPSLTGSQTMLLDRLVQDIGDNYIEATNEAAFEYLRRDHRVEASLRPLALPCRHCTEGEREIEKGTLSDWVDGSARHDALTDRVGRMAFVTSDRYHRSLQRMLLETLSPLDHSPSGIPLTESSLLLMQGARYLPSHPSFANQSIEPMSTTEDIESRLDALLSVSADKVFGVNMPPSKEVPVSLSEFAEHQRLHIEGVHEYASTLWLKDLSQGMVSDLEESGVDVYDGLSQYKRATTAQYQYRVQQPEDEEEDMMEEEDDGSRTESDIVQYLTLCRMLVSDQLLSLSHRSLECLHTLLSYFSLSARESSLDTLALTDGVTKAEGEGEGEGEEDTVSPDTRVTALLATLPYPKFLPEEVEPPAPAGEDADARDRRLRKAKQEREEAEKKVITKEAAAWLSPSPPAPLLFTLPKREAGTGLIRGTVLIGNDKEVAVSPSGEDIRTVMTDIVSGIVDFGTKLPTPKEFLPFSTGLPEDSYAPADPELYPWVRECTQGVESLVDETVTSVAMTERVFTVLSSAIMLDLDEASRVWSRTPAEVEAERQAEREAAGDLEDEDEDEDSDEGAENDSETGEEGEVEGEGEDGETSPRSKVPVSTSVVADNGYSLDDLRALFYRFSLLKRIVETGIPDSVQYGFLTLSVSEAKGRLVRAADAVSAVLVSTLNSRIESK